MARLSTILQQCNGDVWTSSLVAPTINFKSSMSKGSAHTPTRREAYSMQLNGVEFALAEVRKHSGELPSACDFPIGYQRSVITRGLFRFESGTGDFHRQTVERRACGDEERFVVLFSKTNVGWSLGNLDRFEQLSIGRVNLNLITVGRV